MIKIIITTLVFVVTVMGANADVVDDPWAPSYLSYLFHLYYDNGQLFADRDFEFKYDIIAEEFIPETLTTQFPFRGEIVDLKNRVAAEFTFDPRRGNPDFLKGKISVKAPYAPDGQKAVFYDSQGRTLLTIFVSESSFCNDDGVCNSDRGEDYLTCSNDCKETPTTNDQRPTTGGGGQGGMLVAAIYVLIIAGAALGGWFGWKWWKGRRELPTIPPTPPMS
ncbi:MAG: hypothetical protein HYX22_00520 [Candidatus Yanofskybacteria bacterium]|nr:hypothetical protein [Candidatus Yanofskybacteria bacterium]